MPQKPSDAPNSTAQGAPQESARPPKTVSSFLMRRTRAMGSSGLQAATIGWVLAGCVFLGFFAGSWLDGHFKTQYWTPILVLLGVVAGFREMFVTLAEVSKNTNTKKSTGINSTKANTLKNSSATIQIDNSQPTPTERKRERLFTVPAPPKASFDAKPHEAPTNIERAEQKMDDEALLRALMNQEDEDTEDDLTTR